jgi:hypothetical protein
MHFERWHRVDVGCCEQWSFGSWQEGMFGHSSPIFVCFFFFGLQQDCVLIKCSSSSNQVIEDAANTICCPLVIASLADKRLHVQDIKCGGSHTAIISFGKKI